MADARETLFIKIEGAWRELPLLSSDFFDQSEEGILESVRGYIQNPNQRQEGLLRQSPSRSPFLMSGISISYKTFNHDLKTENSEARGTLHLFAKDYADFLLGKFRKGFESLLINTETQEVLISGMLFLESHSEAWLLGTPNLKVLRPVSFVLRSALVRLDFEVNEWYSPLSIDKTQLFIWNSSSSQLSLIHLLKEKYSLPFDLAPLDLPYKTSSFVLEEGDNLSEKLKNLFFEIGYFLSVQDIRILTAFPINIATPKIEEQESIPEITCYTLPTFEVLPKEVQNLSLEWAEVSVKSAKALEAEGRGLWGGKSQYAPKENSKNNEVEIKPFATLFPSGFFPPSNGKDKNYYPISSNALDVNFKRDIRSYNYWVGRREDKNEDIALIFAFDLELRYKAFPQVPNANNPHPCDTKVVDFTPRIKDFSLSIQNTLPKDFPSSQADDGIRCIEWINVIGNVFYRSAKNVIDLKEKDSKAKSERVTLLYVNQKEVAQKTFDRIKSHWEFGNLLIQFRSLKNFPLNTIYKLDSELGAIFFVTLISQTKDPETGIFSYEAINTYEPKVYAKEEWREGVESPSTATQIFLRQKYSSGGLGYVCDYTNDNLTLRSADRRAREFSVDLKILAGVYFIKEAIEFSSFLRSDIEENESIIFEERLSLKTHFIKGKSENIQLVKNKGISSQARINSFVMRRKKESLLTNFVF